jgi:5'-nucleotidase/UDP-sugar diphosphatase
MKVLRRLSPYNRFIFVAFLICLLVSPSPIFAKVYNLTILHTNDHHGHFMKFSPYPQSDVGGLAAQSTLVNIVRAEVEKAGGHVLVLSAGDINTGIPESDLLDAEPDIKAMNMIGYDAMALGNHEFDNPREVLLKQKEWAEFPFLSANVVKKDTGEPLVDPYIIKEFDGLKVAIFGLTTEETPIVVVPDYVQDLEFKSAIDTAKELVPKLREEADIVIALSHLGYWEESFRKYHAPGDLKLAKEVSGIDVIVGGHSHDVITEPDIVGGTMIVQAGEYSEYVGRLDLTIDSETDKVTDYTYTLIPVNMKKLVKYKDKQYVMYVDKGYLEDGEILKAMKPYLEQADKALSEPVGEALVALEGDKPVVRSRETNLANLVTDAMRAKIGVEIAFQNAGGIRATIDPGPITYREILAVQPYGNTLVEVDITGAQIMEILTYAATIDPKAQNGAFLQVSGLKWTNNKGKPENVMVGDAPIDLKKTYTAVTNSFMAVGGDGYDTFKDLPKTDTGFVDADALREYITTAGKVGKEAVEGWLTIIE